MAISEIRRFRRQVGNWLMSVPGLRALVGDRVYYVWPLAAPEFPMITFGIAWAPRGSYPFGPVSGRVTVTIHDPDPETIDAVHDLIDNDLANNEDLLDDLSAENMVACQHFQQAEDAQSVDEPEFSIEDNTFMALARAVPIDFTVVSAQENW